MTTNYTVLNYFLDERGLGIRALNCLHRANIFSIKELLSMTMDEVLAIPYMGTKSALQVMKMVSDYRKAIIK